MTHNGMNSTRTMENYGSPAFSCQLTPNIHTKRRRGMLINQSSTALLLVAATLFALVFLVSGDCSTFRTCTDCLQLITSDCAWCSQTSTCVNSTEKCLNQTIVYIGRMGLRDDATNTKFYNTIGTEGSKSSRSHAQILAQCDTRIESLDECVIGSEYAKVYTPVSTSTRNLQAGGLASQPILPVPQEYLTSYVISNISLSSDISKRMLDRYMDELAYNKLNQVLVGSYLISSSKRVHAEPISLFTNVGYIGTKARYNVTERNTLSVRKSSQGNVLIHLLPSSIGLKALKGSHKIGLVVAVLNEELDQPKCLFYPIPESISVKPVFQDMLVGIYVYVGIPLFLVSFILITIYTLLCPFSDVKKLSQVKYEENEKQEAKQLKSQEDKLIAIPKTIADQVKDTIEAKDPKETKVQPKEDVIEKPEQPEDQEKPSVLSNRQRFSFGFLWKLNSDLIIAQTGLRGYYYWKFYRRLILIVALYTLLAFTIILPVNIVYNMRTKKVIDFAVTTFGSIRRDSFVSAAHYVVSVAFFLIGLIVYGFSVRLTFFKRRYETSIFTARLRHMPALTVEIATDSFGKCYITNAEALESRERLLMGHFNAVLRKEMPQTDKKSGSQENILENSSADEPTQEDPILSVNLIADMEHIMDDIDNQYQLENTLIDSDNTNITFMTKNRLRRLAKSRNSMIEKIKKKPIVTTQAFITFRSAKALRICKEIYKDMKRKMETSTPFSDQISLLTTWKMRQVTWEPEDVEWRNIYDSTRRNVYGTLLVYLVYLLVDSVFIGLFVIYFLRYGLYGVNSGLHFKQAYLTMNSSRVLRKLVPIGLGFTGSIFSVSLTIAGEIANVVIRAVTGLERMKSKSKTSASYLLKSVAIIIPFYLIVPFIGDYQVEYLDTESFYNNISLNLMQFVLSYCFFYKGIELLICVLKISISYWSTGGTPERIPFDFNVAYTSALTIFFIIAVTGIRIPLIFIPGLIFFVVYYLVDTFLLLFFYERAVGTGRIEFGLVSALMFVFSAAAMLLHPSLSLKLLGGSLAFLAIAFGIVAILVFIYNRRGKKRSTTVQVHEEAAYANKYTQPHLEMLLRRSDGDIELNTS